MSDIQLDIEFLINNPAIREAVRKARLDIRGLTDGAGNDVDRLNNGFSMLSKTLAGVFSAHAAKEFIMQLVEVRGVFQQIENSLSTILKSQEAAKVLMAEWKELTLRSPFTLSEIAQSGKQLLAYGVDAKNVTRNIEQLANIASGVSQPLGDIAYLYGTLKTQGRAYQMDINQFTNRGIPIITELAKVMKVADSEVRNLVESGKVGFPEVEKAIANMTGAGGQFFNLVGKQADTLPGQINRLKHEWELMLNAIGTANEGILAGSIGALSTLVEHYQNVIEIIQVLIVTYGAYRAAVILNTVATSGASAAEVLHYGLLVMKDKIMTVLAAKTGSLAAATAAYTAVLAALGVVAMAGIQYQTAAEIAEDSLTTAREKGERMAGKEQQRMQRLVAVIKDHNASKEAQIAAYEELRQTTNGIVDKYSQEEIAAGKADRALAGFAATVKKAVANESEYSQYKALEEKLKAIEEGGMKAISTMDRLWVSIKRTFAPASQDMSFGQWWDELFSSKAANKGAVDGEMKKLQNAQNKILQGANGKGIQSLIAGGGKVVTPEEDEQIKRAKQFANDLKDVIGNFDKLMSGAKSKGDIEKIKEAMTEKINALAPGDAKINEYKAKLQKVNVIEAQYGLKADSKAVKEAEKWADKKADLMDKVSAKSLEVSAKGQTQNQKEIEDAKRRYTDLRKELDDYNSKAPKGQRIGAGTFSMINNLEKKETGNLKYDQDTEKLKETLQKQKQLYADFEAYKIHFGKEKAKERFSTDLDTEKDYLQRLQTELATLSSDQLTGSQTKRKEMLIKEIDEEKLLRNQQQDQRFAEAYEAAKTYGQQELEIRQDYVRKIDALLKSQNGAISKDQRAMLERNRDQAIESAKSEALAKTDAYRRASEQVFEATRGQVKDELKALQTLINDGTITGTSKDKLQSEINRLQLVLNIGVDQAHLDSLKYKFQALTDQLNEKDAAGNSILSKEDTKRIMGDLEQIGAEIGRISTGGGAAKSGFSQGLDAQFEYLRGSSIEMAKGVSDDLSGLAGAFNELSQAFGGSDTQAGYLMGTIGELAKVGSDAAGSFASFASGDIVGGVTKAISAVAGLFSIGKKVKEMNEKARKEQSDFYTEALKGEREYQALLRKRDLDSAARGKNSYRAIIAQLELIKKQSPELQRAFDTIFNSLQGQESVEGVGYKHGTWLRKAKTWDIMASLAGSDYSKLEELYTQGKLKDQTKADFEALKALKEELQAAGIDADELQDKLRQLLTGTTTSGLAQGLRSLFEDGKRAAQDFGNSFQEILRNALLNTFEQKYLMDAMQPFYEELAALMEGNTPSEQQIDALRQKYIQIGLSADEYLKNIEKITGVNTAKNDASGSGSLSGAIRSASQESIDVLSGNIMGFRLAQLEANIISKSGLKLSEDGLAFVKLMYLKQVNIEFYSKMIAENSEQLKRLETVEETLKSIDNKMDSNSQILAGTGRVI